MLKRCSEITCRLRTIYTFERRADMEKPRSKHSACSMRDKYIYTTGSQYPYEGVSKSTEVYDVELNKWNSLPDMNTNRYNHSSCCIDDKWVYVICGLSFFEGS